MNLLQLCFLIHLSEYYVLRLELTEAAATLRHRTPTLQHHYITQLQLATHRSSVPLMIHPPRLQRHSNFDPFDSTKIHRM